ncbi:MAG: NAD kinase [Betaproteobacteria bacterium]|jgi:NAD+ kinase|nr:NAD kinase [Betaproteobacteria bacterium]
MSPVLNPAFKTVALIGRYKSRDVAGPLEELGRFLAGRGCNVLVDRETASESGLALFPMVDREEIGAKADLVVVLGGDGSMLTAARLLAPTGVPLIGVNQGRLGFLTDIALRAMIEQMGKVLAGEYQIEPRTMLDAAVHRDGTTPFKTIALNDLVVNKGATGRLIEILVRIDGEFVYDLRADGLIVATPTGSTAYALSSNGPILHPGVPGLALVPICPHTLSNRPIAVSDGSVIEVAIRRAADALLHFDGHPSFELKEGDRVTVQRANQVLRLVHPPGYSYYAMLREKLHWSETLV